MAAALATFLIHDECQFDGDSADAWILEERRELAERWDVDRNDEEAAPATRGEVPPFMLSDLVKVLRSLPRPDPEFFDELRDAASKQPVVPKSSWRD